MGLELTRIDDRLIHGQVVEGWLRVVQADLIVVASDEVAADVLQMNLMRLAVPPDVEVSVVPLAAAADALKKDAWKGRRVLLLLPGVREARRLLESGAPLTTINLGGMHEAPGRVPVSPTLAFSPQDRDDIRAILALKVVLDVRALPTDEPRDLQKLLSNGKSGSYRDVRPQ
jgi:mannose/fructose/N-acetylgalactosamine-specific phosphotransferase system component IIB